MRRQKYGKKIIVWILAASLLFNPLNVSFSAAYASEEQVETVSGGQVISGDEEQASVDSDYEQTPIMLLSESQKSASVSFDGSNLEKSVDTATILTGQVFSLNVEFNNNDASTEMNLNIRLKASTDKLSITQMSSTEQTIQFSGLESPVKSGDSYIYTLSATIPSTYAAKLTLSLSFNAGSSKTGDSVTIEDVSLGNDNNIEITGIKTVSAKTNDLSVTVSNVIEKGISKTKADSQGNGESFYEVFDTSQITVNSSITNASINDDTISKQNISVEKTIEFKNFRIPYTDNWITDYSVGDTFTYSEAPTVSYEVVTEGDYITGFIAKYSVNDTKIENLSSWKTSFTLKNAIFTGGTPEIDADTELAAVATSDGAKNTFASEKATCTASPHVVIDAKQDKVAVTNDANKVNYTVTGSFTTNGSDTRILRISGETETVSNDYEGDKFNKSDIVVVLKDSSEKEYTYETYCEEEDLSNGFQICFKSLPANEYTFEVKYAATLEEPTAEKVGTEWENTYSIVDGNGNSVDGKSKTLTVAYRNIIDTDAKVAIKKTGKQAADKYIDYDIDLTNCENKDIVSAITEYWPQQIPLKTISNVKDCEIVFWSGDSVLGAYNSTSDTFTVPATLLKDSAQQTAFDKIEVKYINIEANGATTLTFTGEPGKLTKGYIQNRAAVVSGGSSTEILLFGAEMTKKAYKDKTCTEPVTASDPLSPGDTVYFEICLNNTSEEENSYTLYEMPDDDLEFVAAYKEGTKISYSPCNDASGGTMSFEEVTISGKSTCEWVMEYKIKETSTKKEVVNSAYAKTYVEDLGQDVKIPNCTYSVQLDYDKDADVSISKRVYPYLVQTEAESFSYNGVTYNARFLTENYGEVRKSSEATGDDYVAYEITVTNKGPDEANIYEIKDTIPKGLTYVGLPASSDVGTGSWGVGRAAVYQPFQYGKAVSTLAIGPYTTIYNGSADVASESDMPKGSDNAIGEITFTRQDGNDVYFTLKSNSKRQTAGQDYIQLGAYNEEDPLSDGQMSFTVICKVDSDVRDQFPAGHLFTNTAYARTDSTCIKNNPDNSEWVKASDSALTLGDIYPSIEKKACQDNTEKSIVSPGQPIQYKVTVSNNNTDTPLSEFTYKDILPEGYSVVSGSLRCEDDEIVTENIKSDGFEIPFSFTKNADLYKKIRRKESFTISYTVQRADADATGVEVLNTARLIFGVPINSAAISGKTDDGENYTEDECLVYAISGVYLTMKISETVSDDTFYDTTTVPTVVSGQKFNYTLHVTPLSDGSQNLTKLKITDKLPSEGETTGSIQDTTNGRNLRSSDFTVKFNDPANTDDITVNLGETLISTDYYTISKNGQKLEVEFNDSFLSDYRLSFTGKEILINVPVVAEALKGGDTNFTGQAINDYTIDYAFASSSGEVNNYLDSKQVAVEQLYTASEKSETPVTDNTNDSKNTESSDTVKDDPTSDDPSEPSAEVEKESDEKTHNDEADTVSEKTSESKTIVTGTVTSAATAATTTTTATVAATTAPKTGDESNLYLWIILLMMAGVTLICGCTYYRKKRG